MKQKKSLGVIKKVFTLKKSAVVDAFHFLVQNIHRHTYWHAVVVIFISEKRKIKKLTKTLVERKDE